MRPDQDAVARWYIGAQPRFLEALSRVIAGFEGLCLGLLDRQDLARVDELFYEEAREYVGERRYRYTDDAYNLQGLSDWEITAIRTHFPSSGRVVVTGAGAGREVLALCERGYDAFGYEPHPELVAAGGALLRRRGHPGRLRQSARDTFPPEIDQCDAVVVGWGSYMLVPASARRIAFLRGARLRLEEGAPMLLSFFTRSDGFHHSHRVASMANLVRRLRRSEPVEVGDSLFPNYVHRFAREELEAELRAGGFRMIHFATRPYGHAVALAG